jgi:hypothetical protein
MLVGLIFNLLVSDNTSMGYENKTSGMSLFLFDAIDISDCS